MSPASRSAAPLTAPRPVTANWLAYVPGEAGVRVPVAVVPGAHVHHVDVAVEDVRHDLRRRRLVALALRRRAERDDDLAEDVELDGRDLVVAGELEVGVDQLRLPEVVRARVERGADPEPEQLAARGGLGPPLLDPVGADELERHVQRPRVVARVVDAAVRRLVRHVLGLDVVLACGSRPDRSPSVCATMSMTPLGEPELLHPRVAAVRRHGRLVRHRLRELEPDVAPLVHPGRDLRPDDAAERLVAEVRARRRRSPSCGSRAACRRP